MKKFIIFCAAALIVYACKHEIIVTKTVPTNLIYVPTSSTILYGAAGNSVTPTIDNGGESVVYSISDSTLTGISINSNTGVISWSNTVAVGIYSISVTALNSVGSTATTYILNVNSAITAPSSLLYSPASSTVVAGTAGNSATPSINTGGSIITYSLTGTIPSGISINSSTGVISWSNAVAVGSYNLAIKATNNIGNTTGTYTLTVTQTTTVVAPTSFLYNPANSTTTLGTAGNSATPSINNGLGTITYSLSGTIPSGISINSTSGIISWNTLVATGTYNLTVKATNSAGNITASYSLTVNAAPVVTGVCFSSQILPLYQSYCALAGCHNSTTKRSGIELDTYATIMKGIKANNSSSSSYYTIIGRSMPPKANAQMSSAQIALIQQWINQGATNSVCAAACDTTQFTYTNTISTLFANNCVGCHNATTNYLGVILSDYTSAVNSINTITSTTFLSALNYTSATSAMNMPPSGQMSSCQITQITKWIKNGYPQ